MVGFKGIEEGPTDWNRGASFWDTERVIRVWCSSGRIARQDINSDRGLTSYNRVRRRTGFNGEKRQNGRESENVHRIGARSSTIRSSVGKLQSCLEASQERSTA